MRLESARRLARSRPDFGNHNAVAFVNKALEDIFQLRRSVGAVQRPLIGQHRAGFERAKPGAQRVVVAVLQKIARHQVEFKGHSLLKANKRRTSSNIWYDSGDGKVSVNRGYCAVVCRHLAGGRKATIWWPAWRPSHLTPAATARVAEILGESVSLKSISSWPDQIRRERVASGAVALHRYPDR